MSAHTISEELFERLCTQKGVGYARIPAFSERLSAAGFQIEENRPFAEIGKRPFFHAVSFHNDDRSDANQRCAQQRRDLSKPESSIQRHAHDRTWTPNR